MILLSPDAVIDIERLRTFSIRITRRRVTRFGALALIWTAIDRLQEFPALGMPTEDADIRQIVIRFGASGYPKTTDILVTRIWHGRESRV
jgi:hypothetical protein